MVPTGLHPLCCQTKLPARLPVFLLALAACCANTASVARAQTKTERDFRPRRVLPPREPITDAPLMSSKQALDELTDNELVLGVTINGASRAYPINMLTGPSREIINDTLGDHSIAATWCHLCHNTVVFDRRVNEQTLTFAVSGKLWNRNLVMVDSDTGTLWSHFLGEAMEGPLKGSTLTTLPSELTTWGRWRQEHPETTVLNLPRSSRHYVQEFYRQPEDFVYGVVVDGHAHHADFSFLREHPVINLQLNGRDVLLTFDSQSTAAQIFERPLIDGQRLRFVATADGRIRDEQTGSVWDRHTGVAVEGPLATTQPKQQVGMPAYAAAWSAFHPESQDLRQTRAARTLPQPPLPGSTDR